jgi:hypothetical protein
MIPFRSRSDSWTFTPAQRAIGIETNFFEVPYGLFVLGVGALDRWHIMCIKACDEVEPMHESPTIFRELVEIGDPTLLTAELLGIPTMPNETELSSAISASCHRGLRLPLLWQSRQRKRKPSRHQKDACRNRPGLLALRARDYGYLERRAASHSTF